MKIAPAAKKIFYVVLFLSLSMLSGCFASRDNHSLPSANPPFTIEDAIYLHFQAAILEQHGCYTEAKNLLEKTVDDGLSASIDASDEERGQFYGSLAMLVYELAYIYALEGELPKIKTLTDRILTDNNEQRQYILLKNALSLIHLFHTGNLEQTRTIMRKEKELFRRFISSENSSGWLSGLDRITDPYFIDAFLAYAALEDGNMSDMYRTQKEFEDLHDHWFIQLAIKSTELLNVLSDDRAVIFGLAAYGYGMLGMYKKSEDYFKEAQKAIESDATFLSSFRGYAYLAYADASLIPQERLYEASENIEKGLSLIASEMKSEKAKLFGTMMGIVTRPLQHYPGAVKLNLLAHQGNTFQSQRLSEHLFSISQSETFSRFPPFTPATPKILIADALYHVAQVNNDLQSLRNIIDKANRLFGQYQGIHRWKIHYAESLLHEKEDNLVKALNSAKLAVEVLEHYAATPFPDMSQQSTFWKDKEAAYSRVVNLLLKTNDKNKNLNTIASELLYYSSISKTRVNLPVYHAFLLSHHKDGPEHLLQFLQNNLPEESVLIDYWYDESHLIILATNKQESFVESVSLSNRRQENGKSLEEEVERFRESINAIGNNNNHISAGNALYRLLLSKVLVQFGDAKRLYLAPHRILHMLPWNVLSVSNNNQDGRHYLVDSYATILIPSVLSVLPSTFGNLEGLPKDDKITVAIGNGTDLAENQKYITENCNCHILPPESLTTETLGTEMARAKALFLDAHGTFHSENPLNSYLELSDSIAGQERLYFRNIQAMQHTSDFVFLAGCYTGMVSRQDESQPSTEANDQHVNDYPGGEQLAGIYKLLFARGTHVAAVCMDEAHDWGTSRLISHMLGNARRTGDYADIFRDAVIKTKHDNLNPRYWGWCGLIVGG
jgi:CHAT domain-containing protein